MACHPIPCPILPCVGLSQERSLLQKQLTASLTITASAIGAGRRREQDVLLLPGLQVGSWLISFLNSLLFAPVTVEVEFLWRFCNALFG
ncbi:hypothetical protein CLOM_g22191 [Closterium sp. NIES-68]|nr:hypothetical protein CLOM_g22191 [Closterium sp. NIES-68]GJP86236.1 hypothetical protein CLOP_g16282 [Closterium sp. NIES-67]